MYHVWQPSDLTFMLKWMLKPSRKLAITIVP